MGDESREALTGMESEREKERQFIKGALLKSCHCGQLQLNPTRSSGNSLEHMLRSYCARRPEEGAGVFIYQLQPAIGGGLLGYFSGTSGLKCKWAEQALGA